MNENRLFSITAILILLFSQTLFSAPLTANTLQNDIKYYQKVASQKNLSANDRRYILLRIQNKYEGTDVDTASLNTELEKLKAKPVAEQQEEDFSGVVSGISTIESNLVSKITVQAKNVKRSNYFLLKDPNPEKPTMLVLDLYDAEDQLPENDRDINIEKGVFSHVQAGQFEEKPEKIVRITATMRKERPYKISNDNNTWIISAQKEKSEQTAPDKPPASIKAPAVTTPVVPAPAALPSVVPAPAPNVPSPKQQKSAVQNTYTIEAGDILGIVVFPAEELNREVVVQPDGNISLSLIGLIKAKGLTIDELTASLKKSLSKFVSNPKVTISMRKFSRRQIFITGEVRSVGTFEYKENLRLLEFISSLGGFNQNANRREIKVYRGPSNKKQVYMVDIEQVIQSGDFSKDFLIEPGDIIEVQKGGTKVSLLGDISSPGYYDYTENMTMTELISNAHGFKDTSDISNISIIRLESQPDKTHVKKVIKVNLKNILAGKTDDVMIKSGDTVYIPTVSLARANWFIANIVPWLTLITLIIALGGKI